MIENRLKNNLIYKEFDQQNQEGWFSLTSKKFLHNIDTFYYTVKLSNDFTIDSEDINVIKFRNYFSSMTNGLDFDGSVPFQIDNLDVQLNIRPFHFAGFYNFCIECPEFFDIFIADHVPEGAYGESVTSEIVVQLRSYLLWQYGATKSFEYSYNVVSSLCGMFGFNILEVKENRIDYCWHTNYLQNPEKYFRIDNFSKMQVSRYKRIHYEYAFKPRGEYENDYISLGRRNDKCFVRIYLKSKEVVEKGYKPWFLREWLLNGMINRYDFYVYEQAFLQRSWNWVDKARLKFYSEYGSVEVYKKECLDIIDGNIEKSAEYISNLADLLTPRVTLVINVEYQTSRKMTKSYCLKPLRDYECRAECKRIYEYLDNRHTITEYLTHSVLRLVNPDQDDSNKSRADYTDFWKCLRSCRKLDVKKCPKELKLTRDYTRKMNKEIVKKRFISSAVTCSLYDKGINDDNVMSDLIHVLTMLNDNDIHDMKKSKYKRKKLLNNLLLSEPLDDLPESNFAIVRKDTGEIYEGDE